MTEQEAGKVAPRGFHQSGKRNVAELLLFILAIALLILAARGCAGCATSTLVSRIPSSVDASIGKVGGEAMRAQHGAGQTPSAEDQARAARVFEELRKHLTSEEAAHLVSPRLTVLSDAQANAFALPGGEVFVLTGLLDRTKDDDDALRGVLAHELGHAVRRHGVRSLVRNSVYGLVLAYVLGDMGGITATLVAGASHLDELGFSRDMEEDADAFAVDLLQRAGHTPEGLARFMESLEGAPIPQILSTHPDSAARAHEIRARMQKAAP